MSKLQPPTHKIGLFMTWNVSFPENFLVRTVAEFRNARISTFITRNSHTGKWGNATSAAMRQDFDCPGSYTYGSDDSISGAEQPASGHLVQTKTKCMFQGPLLRIWFSLLTFPACKKEESRSVLYASALFFFDVHLLHWMPEEQL